MQKFGEPLTPGHEEHYKRLTNSDIELIKLEIERLLKTPYFARSAWKLSENDTAEER